MRQPTICYMYGLKTGPFFIPHLFQSLSIIYINNFVKTIKALDKDLVFDWQGKEGEHTIIC